MIFTIWLVAISIQLFIAVWLAIQFIRYRDGSNTNPVSISIVIAAHNEFENLQNLIPRLLEQDYADFEIIVALDRSSDESVNFLRGQAKKNVQFVDIKEVPENCNSKKYALTQGIEQAKGDWLVLTDADCIPMARDWLKKFSLKAQGRTKIILGYSPYCGTNSFLQNLIQYEAFVTAFHYLSMAIVGSPYMGVGRNMAISRKFFFEKGGYDTFMAVQGGDDDLFIQKNATAVNTAVILGSDTLTTTYPEKSWTAYLHQKTRHLSIGYRYRFLDRLKHLLFSMSHIGTWLLIPFLRYEFMLPIILFYLIVKSISYRFADSKMGAGFNYMWFPLVDLTYAILLPIIAIRSKLVKDIRWKN